MSKIEIKLNGKTIEQEKGLIKLERLYEILDVMPDKECLYLDKPNDIDIPLLSEDYIVIHGGEAIFSDSISSDIESNPFVRKPVQFIFNEQKIEQGFEHAKVSGSDISGLDQELDKPGLLYVDVSGKADDLIQEDMTLVVQDTDSYFRIPSGDDDSIDLEECSKHRRRPPKGQKAYKIRIDKEKYKVEEQKMSGNKILELAGKNSEEWTLNQKLHGGRRVPIEMEAVIDFSEPGIERFETVMKQAQQG